MSEIYFENLDNSNEIKGKSLQVLEELYNTDINMISSPDLIVC